MEYPAAALEGIPLFEFIACSIADTDALESKVEGEIKEEEKVGLRRKILVRSSDFPGIESANTLIGHGGEIVAVEYDNFAAPESRLDQGFDMFAPVLEKELQFFLGREATGCCRIPKPAAKSSVCRFAREDHAVTPAPQVLGKEAGLGGLAGAVDALEDKKETGMVWSRVQWAGVDR